MRRAEAVVSLGAIEQNCARLRDTLTGGARLCAVVKGDGYGHGAVPVAQAALRGGADILDGGPPPCGDALFDPSLAVGTTLSGGDGDDSLLGSVFDDHLDGGPGTDSVDGRSGSDTCLAEVRTNCELP